jgi:hypothetical protein
MEDHKEFTEQELAEKINASELVKVAEHNAKLKPPYITVFQRMKKDGRLVKEYMGIQCGPNPRKDIENFNGPGFNNNAKIALKRFGKARVDMDGGYYFEFTLVTKA